jgi:hypothetical protein
MDTRKLHNYISRSQVREYLSHIREFGVSEIVESPDGVHAVEPVGIRIGSAINSVKLFHLARYSSNSDLLTQKHVVLVSDNKKPELPDDAVSVGIFYMSKIGRDYSGDADTVKDYSCFGDIGDVICFDASDWDSVSLGDTTDGINYRLFVFWGRV